MKKNQKNNNIIILYALAVIAIIIGVISLTGITRTEPTTDWRCSFANCTQHQEISGTEWARENCQITDEGTTMCTATLDDGRQFVIPLEEINLSAITATKCLSYVCTEEAPYRVVNYPLDLFD